MLRGRRGERRIEQERREETEKCNSALPPEFVEHVFNVLDPLNLGTFEACLS
jgi:hypothetical protein